MCVEWKTGYVLLFLLLLQLNYILKICMDAETCRCYSFDENILYHMQYRAFAAWFSINLNHCKENQFNANQSTLRH